MFYTFKELKCFSDIELLSWFLRKRKYSNVHITVKSPLFPSLPRVSLNAMLWPVPAILTLNNAHNSINLKDHSWVSSMRASSILNDLVNTIKSCNCKEVSRFDFIIWKIDKMRLSFFPSKSSSCFYKINVQLLLIFWWFCTKKGDFRGSAQSSQKDFNCFKNVGNPVFERIT